MKIQMKNSWTGIVYVVDLFKQESIRELLVLG